MYGKSMAAGPAVTAGTLAYTGVNVGWMIVAGLTLLFAGLALVRLVPKLRRRKDK